MSKYSKYVIIAVLLTIINFDATAATRTQILCLKKKTLVVRTNKCLKGEKRVAMQNLVQQALSSSIQGPVGPQGPQGPQGIQGPAGPKGDTAAFDIANCYKKTVSNVIPGYAANTAGTLSATCNSPANEFMLSSSFNPVPSSSTINKPVAQSKSLQLDTTQKYPIGVSFIFTQAQPNPVDGYGAGIDIICCQK